MVFYLVRNYALLWFVIAFLMLFLHIGWAGQPLAEAVPKAVFWTGFLAAAATYLEFRRRKIWPLYDNLRLSKRVILGLLVCANLLLYAALIAWM